MTKTDDRLSSWQDTWTASEEQPHWRGEQSDIDIENDLPEVLALIKAQPRVLVPLCGNSPVIATFLRAGCNVVGIEGVEKAIERLFSETLPSLSVQKEQLDDAVIWRADQLQVLQADLFSLAPLEGVSLIYDRAALIAISPENRDEYCRYLSDSLSLGGVLYLVSIERRYGKDAEELAAPDDGPPYSVSPEWLSELFPEMDVVRQHTSEVFKEVSHLQDSERISRLFKTITIFQKN